MSVKILDQAIARAQELPEADQEQIGRELIGYIDQLRALRGDLDKGLRSLDAGFGRPVDMDEVIERARARHWGAANFSPDTADGHLRDIGQVARNLCTFPSSGIQRDQLVPGIRSILVYPSVIFYRIGDGSIDIVRVVDGRRNLAAIFTTDKA